MMTVLLADDHAMLRTGLPALIDAAPDLTYVLKVLAAGGSG